LMQDQHQESALPCFLEADPPVCSQHDRLHWESLLGILLFPL
jgi:hypothetical protein